MSISRHSKKTLIHCRQNHFKEASFGIIMNANTMPLRHYMQKEREMLSIIYITMFFVSAGNYILKDVKNLPWYTFKVENILYRIVYSKCDLQDWIEWHESEIGFLRLNLYLTHPHNIPFNCILSLFWGRDIVRCSE